MKIIFTILLQIISYLGTVLSSIWAIVEFILYLVKDKAFNWWSIWAILICIGAGIVLFVLNIIFVLMHKKKNDKIKNSFHNGEFKKQSRFQQKLEEMEYKKRHNL